MSPLPGPLRTSPAAQSVGGQRRAVHDPVGHVDQVRRLLDEVVAGEPAEDAPVANLVLHLAHARRLELARPAAGGHVEIGADQADLADRPVADSPDAVQVVLLVPPLQADHHGEPLSPGLFVGGQQGAVAGSVDAQRLFQKAVLAGGDGGRVVHRPEVRRRGQQHQVHARVNHALIGVEAHEPPPLGHVDPRLEVLVFPKVREAGLQPLAKKVAHGHQLDRGLGRKRLAAGARAAVAAADKANADRLSAGRMGTAGDG